MKVQVCGLDFILPYFWPRVNSPSPQQNIRSEQFICEQGKPSFDSEFHGLWSLDFAALGFVTVHCIKEWMTNPSFSAQVEKQQREREESYFSVSLPRAFILWCNLLPRTLTSWRVYQFPTGQQAVNQPLAYTLWEAVKMQTWLFLLPWNLFVPFL